MREDESRSPKTRHNDRARGYRSRPIARVQPRYRTTPPPPPTPKTVQPAIATPLQAKNRAIEGLRQVPSAPHKPKVLPRQPLTKPAHIQRVTLETSHAASSAKIHAYRNSHILLPNVPTLPLGRRSMLSKAVGRVKRMPKYKKRAYALTTIAVVLIAFGSLLNANNATIVKKIEAQIARGDGAVATDSQSSESAAYNEVQPDVTMLGKYTVAPDLPKYLTINSLAIWSRVTKVAADAKGQIGVPKNIFDTGWYEGSVKPGQPGTVVIDGHMVGPTKAGSFIDLSKIKPGAFVSVTTGDNTQYVYRVASTETIAASAVSLQKLLSPYGSAAQNLVLTARDGASLKGTAAPEQQTIVYAVRQ